FAQSRQLLKTDSVFRLIVKNIKAKSATGIYELTSKEFQQEKKLGDFRDFIANTFFLSGEFRKDSLISFVNNLTAAYKLQFDNNSLMLSINLDENNKLSYFKAEQYTTVSRKTER